MEKMAVLFLVAFLSILVMGCIASDTENERDVVCVRGKCFDVEVVSTPQDRNRGLMFRENLAKDEGMLFVFGVEGDYHFWMKNTLIPLDIIWIDQDHEIVYISRNTQPCKADPCPYVDPGMNAKYVLEINGGVSDEFGFELGDVVEFDID
jgi:uncharacterized membrane protein (UPF0127 family)